MCHWTDFPFFVILSYFKALSTVGAKGLAFLNEKLIESFSWREKAVILQLQNSDQFEIFCAQVALLFCLFRAL